MNNKTGLAGVRFVQALTTTAVLAFTMMGAAQAAAPIVIDNATPQFSTTGTWPVSTAVAGYQGPNYQVHQANGAPPTALVVDNTDAGFAVTGTWGTSSAVSGYLGANYRTHEANGAPPAALVADNASGTAVGSWPASTAVSGYLGANYQTHAAGTGTESFTWTVNVPMPGTYQAYARWTAHPNRAINARYTVAHAGGQDVVTVNQQANGGSWQLLGTYGFNAGAATVTLTDQANGYVIADAVMLLPPGAAPNAASWTVNVPVAGTYQAYARWTVHANRATDAKYSVNHAGGSTIATVNQRANGGSWQPLGSFSFNAGTATITLTDQANGYVIADAVMLLPPGAAPNSATWTPNVSGQHEVYAKWTAHPNRATDAKYTVNHASGATQVTVNQQLSGGIFNLLGSFNLTPASTIVLTDQANGYVIADAIQLVPTGPAPQQIYFIHTDHLNTPRAITNSAGQLVWAWANDDPFGGNVPDENPSGLGTFEFPLRDEGTYSDKETGLVYNVNRYRDLPSGRFIQADPLGLAGGDLSLYVLRKNNPLSFTDPLGLDVRVSFFENMAFGFGHLGIGIVTAEGEQGTVGFYPQPGAPGDPFAGVPGAVLADPSSPSQTMVIPTRPQQDQCVTQCINERTANPGIYNVTARNCKDFVFDCLTRCGIKVRNVRAPAGFYNYLRQLQQRCSKSACE